MIAVGAVFFVRQAMRLPWTYTRIVGIAIAAPAFLLFIVARIQLGGAFSMRAKASNLVTTGLYSRIRNPIYVFSSFLCLGLIVWLGTPRLVIVLFVIIPLQIYRSRNEARVLEQRFGSEYLAYRQKTWF